MERVILRHLRGSRTGVVEEYPLATFGELLLGRDPASQVRFDPAADDLVGRQHARILRDPGDPYRFALVDLDSRNGTFLNRMRVVGTMPLQPGDVIQLGAGGPELQFDLDPLPARYVKDTRLAVQTSNAPPPPPLAIDETRVASPGAAQPAGAAPTAGDAADDDDDWGTLGSWRQPSRTALIGAAVVAMLAVGGLATWAGTGARDTAPSAAADSVPAAALAATAATPVALAALSPAEVAARYSAATVHVDFSWNLIYSPTGAQVFHRYVPNEYGPRGKRQPIMNDGRPMIPAYVAVAQNVLEPALTLDDAAGAPIAVSSGGSGFVVTPDGFIITNRHVAANWRAPYRFDPNRDVGVLLDGNGQLVGDAQGNPVVVAPPMDWIPSETKQTGPKSGGNDVFRGRQEYLMVRFPKNTNPAEATLERVSDRHDVALIKINTPAKLPTVELHDAYDEAVIGDAVTVLGYPSISDFTVAVLKSKDTFNRDAQQRMVPEPTLSAGNIGKVVRAADGPVSDAYAVYAPYGDRYQLTINSTGGGNSGGPMFDAQGRVIGVFFAGRSGDAQVSFSVPIRYGLELMSIAPTTR